MLFFLFALLSAAIGTVPVLFSKRWTVAAILAAVYFLLSWLLFYCIVPSLVWPLGGLVTIFTIVWTIISAIAGTVPIGYRSSDANMVLTWALPVIGIFSLFVSGCSGCTLLRSNDYANLIGQFQERQWTQDVQPKDPKNIRLVSNEAANFLADKQLGSAQGGVIGSQFKVDEDCMALQVIHGELWYVAPLDFIDIFKWWNADVAPGYVMVHGCDPYAPVKVVSDKKFMYTPGAYFDKNLMRHLWYNGYMSKGLTDISLELDEDLNPWWVVSVYEPTISWWGEKAIGVAVVNPTSGEITFHALGSIPKWIDRCVPASFAKDYVTQHGSLSGGFWNSIFAQKNVTQPESATLVYGADHQPYWVMAITSTNGVENSMVGLYYIDSRTGETFYYRSQGSTETGVLTAVNNKVSYKKWHGSSPVLYNIYGTMAYIVPVLGENHTFQEVAICDVNNMLVAEGKNELEAYRDYQKQLQASGQQIAPEFKHNEVTITITADRISYEPREGNYYIYNNALAHIFICGAGLSPKLPITKSGDAIFLKYVDTPEDVIPVVQFDNKNIVLSKSTAQGELKSRVEIRTSETQATKNVQTIRDKIKHMSDKEIDSLFNK
jgi:hypothetical protein